MMLTFEKRLFLGEGGQTAVGPRKLLVKSNRNNSNIINVGRQKKRNKQNKYEPSIYTDHDVGGIENGRQKEMEAMNTI